MGCGSGAIIVSAVFFILPCVAQSRKPRVIAADRFVLGSIEVADAQLKDVAIIRWPPRVVDQPSLDIFFLELLVSNGFPFSDTVKAIFTEEWTLYTGDLKDTRKGRPVAPPQFGDHPPLDPTIRPTVLIYSDPDQRESVRNILKNSEQLRSINPELLIGIDVPIEATDHWCPSDAAVGLFGHRADTSRLVGLDFLLSAGARGRDVNVIVVDDGVDAAQVPPGHFGGGWTTGGPPPGTKSERGHGTMVTRNVLGAAPEVIIWDCRILPQAIVNPTPFLASAQAAFRQMVLDIWTLRSQGRGLGPWVFVNAWGIFSREAEVPRGDYTNRPSHPFNRMMRLLSRAGFDTVFSAGNCGQFCPSNRCGPSDRGPGQSILGANSHRRVLTVGAVRNDGLWLGYSSQGPGQPYLSVRKPDLCAPSQFREDGDAHRVNSGTSAACALAAGVISALRSHWGADVISPSELRLIVNLTALIDNGPRWEGRLGHGIIDAKAAWLAANALQPLIMMEI
jgi:subtilisin family serine protease